MASMLTLKIRPELLALFPSKDDMLCRLECALDKLPNLPKYKHNKLLFQLCFLLRSPSFLYTMTLRVRAEDRRLEPLATRIQTSQSLQTKQGGHDSELPIKRINVAKLNIEVKWEEDGNSWVTRLRYGESNLIEGRHLRTTKDAGFVQSFKWFCEEVEFLYYEYRSHGCIAEETLGPIAKRKIDAMELDETERSKTEHGEMERGETEHTEIERGETRALHQSGTKKHIVVLK
ncbi:hypothetical protein PtrSN001C_010183 [Pyrenophora tritici-repentis]|nr:hypothetical protein PtrSN001C_010183 [Pyrenophora tritici-repentis]KAI1564631.1 hypothetical protein PtrEW7m1_010173 [Pyrenophora tritici-repentis]